MSPYELHMHRAKRGMSPTSEILLDMIAICGKKPPMFVEIKRAAVVDGVCSLPSGHIHLHWLIKNGYLVAEQCKNNRRAKRLLITAKGWRHIKEVSA